MRLRTGAILIGVLNLIGCVIGAFVTCGLLVGGVYAMSLPEYQELVNDGNSSCSEAFSKAEFPPESKEVQNLLLLVCQNLGSIGPWILVAIGIVFVICLFYIMMASLLIHGARTGRAGMLMPWIIWTWISFVLQIITLIGSFVALNFGGAVTNLISLIIEGYILIGITSLRKQLREGGGNSMSMTAMK